MKKPFYSFGGRAWALMLMLSLNCLPTGTLAATNWTRLAILPFDNSSGDKTLDLWRKEFANRLFVYVTYAHPFKFEVPKLDKVVSTLTNSGWRAESEITTELAGKVAGTLRCSAVLLGEFSRTNGLWKVMIRIIHPGSEEGAQSFQVEDRSTHQLERQLLEETCASLGLTPYAAMATLMRDYPVSDDALEKLAKLEATPTEAGPESIKILRDILASETNYYSARVKLTSALLMAKRMDEARA